MNKKHILNILFILLIGGLSVSLIIGKDFSNVLNVLKTCNIYWVIFTLGLMTIFYILNAYNLTIFTKIYKPNYTFREGLSNSMIGIFFNAITPMASGGQFYQVYYYTLQGIDPAISSGILVVLFIVYQIVLVLYTTIIMIFSFGPLSKVYSGFFLCCFVGFIANIAIILMLICASQSKQIQKAIIVFVSKILKFVRVVKDDSFEISMYKKMEEFQQGLDVMKHHKFIVFKAIVVNVVRLTILYSMPYFCAHMFNIDVNYGFMQFVFLTAFIHMISDVIPLPGASGGSEGTFYYLYHVILKTYVNPILLLWRFFTYYFGFIVGLFFYIFRKKSN